MYDFFISFKCTDNGNKTRDCEIAEELYARLEAAGYRVFFSEQILEKDGITKYISEIDQALNDAQTFILVCSKKQYILSGWVAQEWSSFLNLMMTNDSKKLFSYLIDLKESELPALLGPFQSFQHHNGMDKAVNYLKSATRASHPSAGYQAQTIQEILDGEFGIFGHLKPLDFNSLDRFSEQYRELSVFIRAHYLFRQGSYEDAWSCIHTLAALRSSKGCYLASLMHKRGLGTKRSISQAKAELKRGYGFWTDGISPADEHSEILLLVFDPGSNMLSPIHYMASCIYDILNVFGLRCTMRALRRDSRKESLPSLKDCQYILFLSNSLEGFERNNYLCPEITDELTSLDKHTLKLGIHHIRQINMPKPFRKYKIFELSRNGIGKYCQYLLRKNMQTLWNDKGANSDYGSTKESV